MMFQASTILYIYLEKALRLNSTSPKLLHQKCFDLTRAVEMLGKTYEVNYYLETYPMACELVWGCKNVLRGS